MSEEERKVVTVLFADLVGFTTRSEQLDPEDVRAMLRPYYARLRKELERHGGTVEKFIGDAVMALFGAPLAREDDPERAVRAALAIRKAIDDLNAAEADLGLHLRIGVNTGEALVTLDARPSEGEGMAAGDVVNTAARLQTNAPVDGILVGEATYRATADAIEYRKLEPIHVKGKAEPLPVWEVISAKGSPAGRRTSRTPLVGRSADLDALADVWEQVRSERRPGVAMLLGPPGIGKSRLLAHFAETVAPRAAVHWGRCLPYGEDITYWPVAEILKGAAGIMYTDEPATASAKLDALFVQLGGNDPDQLRSMVSAVSTLVTLSDASRPAKISQAELHWGITRIFGSLAAKRPLVLVFEDLHWAEPTLLELLESISRDAEGPVLLLGSARPELVDSKPAILAPSQRIRIIELAALTAQDSASLVAGLLGSGRAEGPALDELLRKAGGNPLFLEEIVRMLGDVGALDARGQLAAAVENLPVPSNLRALIGSRLDQLPSPEKRVAQNASVVGGVFWTGAVAHIEQRGDGDFTSELDDLQRRDLVRASDVSTISGEREYAFKHILIRDVAYGTVPKGRRAELHMRCAEWVEALPAGADAFVEIVAYHLEQACRLAREVSRSPVTPPVLPAIEALARAAEKAERRDGHRVAERFYARALDLVGDAHPRQALELRLRHGSALKALGELGRAGSELLEVAEKATALGRPDLRGGALVGLANIDSKQGRAKEAQSRLSEAASIATGIGDRRLQVRATCELAMLRAHYQGEMSAAVTDLQGAVAIAEDLDDRALRIEGHMRMGTLLFNMGELAEADEHLQRCTELAHEAGSLRDESRATSLLAFVKCYRGDVDEAEALALQAADWFERTDDTYLQVQNWRGLGMYALAKGNALVAEERLRTALSLASESQGWQATEIQRLLVDALVRQGRVPEARELAESLGRDLPPEDSYARAAALLAEATVATADGDTPRAVRAFGEALVLLEQQHLEVDLGQASIAFARALRIFADDVGARRELERARGIFTRMDARGLLEEIERELTAMTKGTGVAGPPHLR